jgi:hypothetical protein
MVGELEAALEIASGNAAIEKLRLVFVLRRSLAADQNARSAASRRVSTVGPILRPYGQGLARRSFPPKA